MKVYSISGYDEKGKFHFFYYEAENKIEVHKWIKQIGFNYPKINIEFVCNGGYENIK